MSFLEEMCPSDQLNPGLSYIVVGCELNSNESIIQYLQEKRRRNHWSVDEASPENAEECLPQKMNL